MSTEEVVEIDGRHYKIIRKATLSARASAELRHGDIVITLPVFMGRERASGLFADLKSRIIKKIRRGSGLSFRKSDITFRDGQVISVLGMKFAIDVESGAARKRSTARLRGTTIRISTASNLGESDALLHASNLARRAISKAVLPALEERVRDINAAHFNASLGRVRLKDNTSNWGSCSGPNNINLDFRLLFAPTSILDAVIAHELAHTKHRNHSKRFYSVLQGAMPDYKYRRRWLRQNGNQLGSEAVSAAFSIALPGRTQQNSREKII